MALAIQRRPEAERRSFKRRVMGKARKRPNGPQSQPQKRVLRMMAKIDRPKLRPSRMGWTRLSQEKLIRA